MYLSLKGSLGHTPITDRVGEGPLQIAEGAAAAYSLRNLGSNSPSVVRVRRESDNNERDFTAQDISTSVLTNWVNEQIVPPLDIGVLTPEGRIPVPEGGTSIGTPAAAYSLRNLSTTYTGNVVDVRRSSDNTVASFTAAEVADGTLADWVTEEQVGWSLQPTWDVSSGDGVITSQSSTATTSTFSITTTSGNSFVRQSSKPNHVIASSGDQIVANITSSGFDAAVSARVRTAGTNTDAATATLTNGTADYTFNLTGSGGYFAFTAIEATSGATITFNSIKVIGQSGFVSKWYDQSSNDNHAIQGTLANQPKIVGGGSLVSGGLLIESDQHLNMSSNFSFALNNLTSIVLGAANGGQGVGSVVGLVGNLSLFSNPYRFSTTQGFRYGGESATSQPRSAAVQLFTLIGGSTTADGYANGTLYRTVSSVSTTYTNKFVIGSYSGNLITGKVAEIIIYNADQSNNRTAIEANIGEVYGIAGIPAYDNTVNGFVETWYDQSGNGNDATQSVAGSQPKIVSAGALVTGGLVFDGVDDGLDTPSLITSVDLASSFVVAKQSSSHTGVALALSRNNPNQRWYSPIYVSGSAYFGYGDSATKVSLGISDTSEYLFASIADGINATGYINSVSKGTSAVFTGLGTLTSGGIGSVNLLLSFLGTIAEIIVYNSDQSSSRVAIETNINDHYNIY
jgi:hypothetical protein